MDCESYSFHKISKVEKVRLASKSKRAVFSRKTALLFIFMLDDLHHSGRNYLPDISCS